MRTVTAIIACVLATFAVLHAFIPNHLFIAFLFGAGAFLAAITIIPRSMGIHTARFLALCTTALMFFYFAGFFSMAPEFEEGWHKTGAALDGLAMLLSAFLMIPVLSCYSCLLKAEGCEQFRTKKEPKRGAFFSVPDHIKNHT